MADSAASATAVPVQDLEKKSYTVLLVKYVDNMLERRAPFREAHLKHLQALKAAGKLVNAGPFTDPVDGSMHIYQASKEEVAEFVAGDPYVANGLVLEWTVRTWEAVL